MPHGYRKLKCAYAESNQIVCIGIANGAFICYRRMNEHTVIVYQQCQLMRLLSFISQSLPRWSAVRLLVYWPHGLVFLPLLFLF